MRLFSADHYIFRMEFLTGFISKFTRLRAVSRRQHGSYSYRRRPEKKKEREGKERYTKFTKSHVGYISPLEFRPISTKTGTVLGVDDVGLIIQTNFGFNILRGFRSTGGGGQNLHFPIDFAGHRYNS